MKAVRQLSAAVLVAALVACGGGGDGGAHPTAAVRDSAGVRIVESPAALADRELGWTVAPEPSLDVGGDEAPETQFYQVTGAARLSDGGVAVTNAGTEEIRVFDATGAFLGSAGGQGGGPGEFRAMTLVAVLPGDSILLYDTRNVRFSVMAPAPSFARSFEPDPETGGNLRPFGVLANGGIAAQGTPVFSGSVASGTVLSPPRPLVILGPAGSLEAVADTYPSEPRFFESTQGFSITRIPFAAAPQYAVSADRVLAGPGDRYEVRAYDGDGRLAALIRLDRPPRPVTDADIDVAVERSLARAREEARPALRRSYQAMPFPDAMPAYARILVDGTGLLWVEDYRAPGQDEPQTWTVFDSDGQALGRVTVPDDLYVDEIGEDWVLGHTRDELDETHIVLHELRRRGT